MNELNKVVARFANGRLVKGTTQDFFPNRPLFHVAPVDGGAPLEIRCKDLKALFFVRDFAGDANRKDPSGFLAAPAETRQGKKIAVLFRDGELLCGYTLTFSPDREGFFLFPADAAGNNERVYAVTAACAEIKAGPAADLLVQKVVARRAA